MRSSGGLFPICPGQDELGGGSEGKFPSPARRRACVDHVTTELACPNDWHAWFLVNIPPRSATSPRPRMRKRH